MLDINAEMPMGQNPNNNMRLYVPSYISIKTLGGGIGGDTVCSSYHIFSSVDTTWCARIAVQS